MPGIRSRLTPFVVRVSEQCEFISKLKDRLEEQQTALVSERSKSLDYAESMKAAQAHFNAEQCKVAELESQLQALKAEMHARQLGMNNDDSAFLQDRVCAARSAHVGSRCTTMCTRLTSGSRCPQLNSTQAELVQLTEKYNALLARVQRVCAAYTGPSRTALFTLANHYVLVDVPGTHPQGTPSRH